MAKDDVAVTELKFGELQAALVRRGAKVVSADYTSSSGSDEETQHQVDVDCDYDSFSDIDAARKLSQLAGASTPKFR